MFVEKEKEVAAVLNNNRNFNRSCQGVQREISSACRCQNDRNAKALIKKLQIIDFSIIETVLYLDAYPNSKSALSHYHKLTEERAKLSEALAALGMPISCFDNDSADKWNWTNGPWPWESEAN